MKSLSAALHEHRTGQKRVGAVSLAPKTQLHDKFFLDFWFWNFSEKIVKNIFQEFFPGLFGEETFRYRAFLMLWHQLKKWASELKK